MISKPPPPWPFNSKAVDRARLLLEALDRRDGIYFRSVDDESPESIAGMTATQRQYEGEDWYKEHCSFTVTATQAQAFLRWLLEDE